MITVKIEELLLGYRILTFSLGDLSAVASLLFRNGIPFSYRTPSTLIIREKYIQKAEVALSSKEIKYSLSKPHGVLSNIKNYLHKVPLLLGIFISIFLVFVLSDTVWDIRIEGNETITDSVIEEQLNTIGFFVGTRWSKTDINSVEANFLDDNSKVAWININRQGTVAYIIVKEKSIADFPDETAYECSNIVASESCVIEEITVVSGTAMVKVGDAVEKGDILILGVTSEESGSKLCRAKGEIIGRSEGTTEIKIARTREEKRLKDLKIGQMEIKIFNFSINIFKIYRNLGAECDIIEEKSAVSFFGLCNLPIEITKKYVASYSKETVELTDTELIDIAEHQLNASLYKALLDVDLCSMRTYGEFVTGDYIIGCRYVYTCDVASEIPVYLEEK